MNIDLIVLFILIALNAFLGIAILRKNKEQEGRLFSALIFCVTAWSVTNYLSEIVNNHPVVWVLIGTTYALAVAMAYFFFRFSLLFPKETILLSKGKRKLVSYLALIFAGLSFTPLIIGQIQIIDPVNTVESGTFLPLFVVFFLFLITAGFLILLKKQEGATREEWFQIRYVIWGTLLTVVGASLTNLIIPLLTGDWGISSYGPFFTIFLIVFTVYAITKHHLFALKVIATEFLTATIWFFLLFQTLLAKDLSKAFISGGLLVFCIIFGVFLIRGVIREIEQREKLEQLNRDLEAANKKLQELDAVKSRFLSFASHQVKTPMTAIKGFACLIYYNADKLSKPKIKQMADKMKLSTDRTISLVNNLLDLRKIEEGRMQYAFEEAKIADVTREVIEELRLIAQEKGLYFVLETPTYEGTVRMDVQKMREVMQNLVENAIKYTDKGWVRVAVTEKEGKVLFSVRDSGRGITENALPLLFKEYERGSAVATAIQGTGLGLFIAKQIVTDHDGRIWAESTGDKRGSSFFVELPLTVPAGEPQTQAVPTMPVVTI